MEYGFERIVELVSAPPAEREASGSPLEGGEVILSSI